MRFWLLLLTLLTGAVAAQAEPVRASREGKVAVELAPQTASAVPGGTVYVALRQQIDRGWHTYWRNAGDSGEPTQLTWTLPPGWSAGEIVWPTPTRQPASPTILNYGYADEIFLPVPIAVPASARPGETVTLKARAAWLVCKEVCIPEEAEVSIALPVAAATPAPHPRFGAAVSQAVDRAPKPAGLDAAFTRVGDSLKLAITGEALADANKGGAYFFPFDGAAITHSAPQTVEAGPNGLTLTLEPGYAFQAPEPPATLAGVLSLADGQAFELEAASGGAQPVGAAGLGAPTAAGGSGGGLAARGAGLPLMLAFALLGGLILNLMPCVFPILGVKAASLAAHAHDRQGARVEGLAFAAGVLVTFLALAGTLIALQAAGQAVGWGFQLQSPTVVAGLALLMLLVGLNLSGVFEMGGSLQQLGNLGPRTSRSAIGAFATGALAVVVAAPCTAPFMGVALGWALTQPPAVALLVFAALAIGFAAPFTALCFAPGLLARLPRPGPWMDGLRKLLAFPMYAAALWLAWVFAQQAGTMALAWLFAAGLTVAFAAWLFGLGERLPMRLTAAAAGVAAAGLVGVAATRPAAPPSTPGAATAAAAIATEPFSPDRLAALRAEGRPVFVNFTADWCVTCKVNEQGALGSAKVAHAFAQQGVVYLKGDWTRRDAVIARTLAEHGRSGVPLYLLYAPGAEAPRILPQLLTEGAVVAALKSAAAGPGDPA